MAFSVFKDLCLDAVDRDLVAGFWAAVLGSTVDKRDEAVALIRHPLLHGLWINSVSEPKVVKNRVHLDLYAPSPGPLVELGASVYDVQDRFVVLQDPGGNESCVTYMVAARQWCRSSVLRAHQRTGSRGRRLRPLGLRS